MPFLDHNPDQVGFDFELVQYQWPSWLHKQTDKQRIIWGYKILFLDVMFPLHLRKIIYIDADQAPCTHVALSCDVGITWVYVGFTWVYVGVTWVYMGGRQ